MYRSRFFANVKRAHKVLGVGLATSSLVLGGCSADAGGGDFVQGDESTGSVEQAFSGIILGQRTATSIQSFVIGSTATQACFLAGIGGRLAMLTTNRTGASITKSGSNWMLTLRTQNNVPIRADFVCVNPFSGLTNEVNWSSGNASAIVAPVSAGRRCFLTRVESTVGGQLGASFESSTDEVRVQQSGNNWVLGGSTNRGKIEATARCITYSPDSNWNYIAANNATIDGPMMVTGPGQGACMLEGVKGAFIAMNDTSDGVQNWYNGSQWFMRVKNAKSGWARCGQ